MPDEETKTSTEEQKETKPPEGGAEEEKQEGAVTAPPEDESEDKEPGGDEPQAVRARKEYRARKAAERLLEQEKLERVRLSEHLRVIEEQRTQPRAQKIYTPDEIQTAITTGSISQAEGMQYLARVEAQRVRAEERAAEATRQPLERAKSQIQEYVGLVPDLADETSQAYRKAETEYRRLVADGLPANESTKLVAVRYATGSLETLRQKKEMASTTRESTNFHAETGAGTGTEATTRTDISKAPKHLQDFWNRRKTSQKARETEWKIYQRDWGRRMT